jgi:hypothetical protein
MWAACSGNSRSAANRSGAGLHRRYVDIDDLEEICKRAGRLVDRVPLHHCFAALEIGDLLHHAGGSIYRMHPALGGFPASRHPSDEVGQRAFMGCMIIPLQCSVGS